MFIKRNLIIALVALAAVVLIAGCGAALKESGGDQTGAGDGLAETAEYVGLDNCFTCHDQTKFNQWAKSRHANFDLEGGERIDYTNMEEVGNTSGVTYSYTEITGDPDPHPDGAGGDRCAPCHTGEDYGGFLLDINANGDVFTNPDIGQVARPIIGCESCHGGGSLHYGVGALPYPTPAYDQCTDCHASADHDHHGVDSYRYWKNALGDNPGGNNAPAISSTADGLTVWSLPSPLGTAWAGTYAGPYYFVPDRTIDDTHYNQVWITNEDDKLTILAVSTAKLGYVDTSNSSPNSGMANAISDDSCTASCHDPHVFDQTINKQWAAGGHRPIPMGPLSGTTPSAPANWGAIDHDFSAACMRCHSSEGFAEMAGTYGDVTETVTGAGSYITCNACHDGVNDPSAANTRLRLNGDANIFAYTGTSVALVVDDAGPSATCISCHQGRSTGLKIKDQYASALSTSNFGSANSHYLAAAGILWKTSGYEYGDSPSDYNNKPYFEHDVIGIDDTAGTGSSGPCVTCHMSGEPSNHYFTVEVDGDLPTLCADCHAGAYTMTQLILEEESTGFEEALDIIAGELEAEGVFYLSSYPYFFNTSAGGYSNAFKSWTSEGQLGAAFNLNLLAHEPGAFAHNRFYAKRLVFDSIDILDNGTLDRTIGDYSATYPNGAAWLGTARP